MNVSQHTDDLFRVVVEATPGAILMVDREGRIVLLNSQVERLFGYSRSELLGQKVEILLPERYRSHHPGFRTEFFADLRVRPMGAGRDLYALHKDGTEVAVEIGLNPVQTPEGPMILSSIID